MGTATPRVLRCELVVAAASSEQADQVQAAFEAMRDGDLILGSHTFGRERVDDFLAVDFFENDYFVEFSVRDFETVRELLMAAREAFPDAELNAMTQTTGFSLRPGEELSEYSRLD